MTTWATMDTAPKDHQIVIQHNSGKHAVAHWYEATAQACCGFYCIDGDTLTLLDNEELWSEPIMAISGGINMDVNRQIVDVADLQVIPE